MTRTLADFSCMTTLDEYLARLRLMAYFQEVVSRHLLFNFITKLARDGSSSFSENTKFDEVAALALEQAFVFLRKKGRRISAAVIKIIGRDRYQALIYELAYDFAEEMIEMIREGAYPAWEYTIEDWQAKQVSNYGVYFSDELIQKLRAYLPGVGSKILPIPLTGIVHQGPDLLVMINYDYWSVATSPAF